MTTQAWISQLDTTPEVRAVLAEFEKEMTELELQESTRKVILEKLTADAILEIGSMLDEKVGTELNELVDNDTSNEIMTRAEELVHQSFGKSMIQLYVEILQAKLDEFRAIGE